MTSAAKAGTGRPLELWGGVECTVNRTGDVWRDQSLLTGHDRRTEDVDRLAGLGVTALRVPLLWERVSPHDPAERDWSWSDARLARMRALGMRPIGGLVHHGSGPVYTSLLDESFATGLAAHALAVAERYPWIVDWTPVNEPLTTARFSALYGHWYPHARDERLFWLAVLNQVEATILAMQAIRSVIPDARLIQTDDLGRTWSTARLAEQAEYDNERRWMGWDLLCGKVDSAHPLWDRLCSFGLEPALRRVLAAPCPPDVIGVNHYLTSDRFLDHRVQLYPRSVVGGNGAEAYADVEAIRVLQPAPDGFANALRDAWDRYRIPLAVTEVHNGCTREEQMRWIARVWNTCLTLRAEGLDVRAVTAWALFGNQGWNTLLTDDGLYEPGAWDIRGEEPRLTAIGGLLQSITPGEPITLPAHLAGQGWWERDVRLLHAPAAAPAPMQNFGAGSGARRPPILILGATGTLGQAFARSCSLRNLPFVLLGRSGLDLASPASIAAALDEHKPWALINAAGWVRVDEAEDDPDGCMAVNAGGAIALARACDDRLIACVSFSSDLVFGGEPAEWFLESDRPAPLNVYGRSKSAMEDGILALGGKHLLVRTAAFFSPDDVHNFAAHTLDALRQQRPMRASDCVISPTYVPDLCHSTLDLLIDQAFGLWHLSNTGAVSWVEFASRIADACGLDASLVKGVASGDMGWAAPRPGRSALASGRGSPMPSLDNAIERFARAMA